jgi:hypothetical protein
MLCTKLRSGGLQFQANLSKKVGKTSHLKGKMLGVVVVHTCHPNDSRNLETERS